MRRVIPLLFILLLSAPFLGTFSWLKMEKHIVRKSIKHKIIDGIDAELLVHMSFAKADTATKLNWKHKKEFSFNGEMYDIVERIYTEDSVIYALWWDNEETQLNKKLDQLTNNFIQRSPEKESKSSHFGFVVKQFFCNERVDLSIVLFDQEPEFGWLYRQKKVKQYSAVDSPPPKFKIHIV